MPKKLPKFTSNNDGSEGDRLRFARWLQCWNLSCELGGIDLSDDEALPDSKPLDVAIAAFDGAPKVGEIRLLSHAIAGETLRPIYVAVIHASEDEFLVMPFGRFPYPATPGEVSTGIEDHRFDLACSWNARILPSSILEQSWSVGHIDDVLRAKLHAHFKALARGLDFESSLVDTIGPPLNHPEDPRWDYLEEEKTALQYLDEVCLEFHASSTLQSKDVIEFPVHLTHMRMAAAAADDRRIPVYLFNGTKESLINQLPNLPDCPVVYGETVMLTWSRDALSEVIGVWTLSGDSLPTKEVPFELLDTNKKQWVGEGKVLDQGKTATLLSGHWNDLSEFEGNTTGLVLVIFNHL
ncbi:hypothetical protein ACWPKS_02700 [Coraliomargarita sp. W4R72]